MSIGALDAAAAYGRILEADPPVVRPRTPAEGGGFAGMIEQMVTDTASGMHRAEGASALQLAGRGDLVDVATAIGAAETALDTVVAVRDRMVNAYSEIMRMQI